MANTTIEKEKKRTTMERQVNEMGHLSLPFIRIWGAIETKKKLKN